MSPPLRCSAARARFGEYLQGQLPPAGSAALDQHLRGCPACRQVLALEQRLRTSARPRIAVPADFAAAVLARPRPVRASRVSALLRTAAADAAFRALVDPLLWLDLHLRDAGAALRQQVTAPLAGAQEHLRSAGLNLYQYVAFPLRRAGGLLGAALAGPTGSR
jgi:hypothetical protein